MQPISIVYGDKMTLRPLATRVPREIEQDIREVTDYMDVEKAQTVRIILEIGRSEWRKRTALELLRDGKVTFAKAAKFSKLDLWEFADIVMDRKIEWVKIRTGELEEEVRNTLKAKG